MGKFCIEKISQETSSTNGKGQWEVVGKYDWTKLFPVKLWTNPKGSGYPNKDVCPEDLKFQELNKRTIKGEKLQEDIKVRVARGNLVPKYQREYDALADEDSNVKISESQSEFMQNVRDFMFHWYLVEPYWSTDGNEEEMESDTKVILTYKDGGGPRLPLSSTDTAQTNPIIPKIRELLDILEKESPGKYESSTPVAEPVVEEETEELSEDDEIDRLLNEDPMSSGGE